MNNLVSRVIGESDSQKPQVNSDQLEIAIQDLALAYKQQMKRRSPNLSQEDINRQWDAALPRLRAVLNRSQPDDLVAKRYNLYSESENDYPEINPERIAAALDDIARKYTWYHKIKSPNVSTEEMIRDLEVFLQKCKTMLWHMKPEDAVAKRYNLFK